MEIVIVVGSPTPPGRLLAAVTWLVDEVEHERSDVSTTLLQLRDVGLSWADGRSLDQYGDATAQAVRRVIKADAVILATPIYRASYTGMLKNFLDLLPVEALMGKTVGMMAIAATESHFLALENQLRPVLAWFGAVTTPVSAFIHNRQFTDGIFVDPDGKDQLLSLHRGVVTMQNALARRGALGPAPLAARS